MPTIRDMQKEYTKFRDIFQKRVKRAYKAGYSQAVPYLRGNVGYIEKISEIKELPYIKNNNEEVYKRDLERRLKELKRLVSEGVSSIKEIKLASRGRNAKISKALEKAGYNIPPSVVRNFGQFMDKMRELYGRRLPNSEEIVEFYDSLKYSTKRRSADFLVNLWKEYEGSNYGDSFGGFDLFST